MPPKLMNDPSPALRLSRDETVRDLVTAARMRCEDLMSMDPQTIFYVEIRRMLMRVEERFRFEWEGKGE